MYSISNYFPFLDKADFVKNVREVHAVEEFLGYEPLVVDLDSSTKDSSKKVFKAYRIMPSNTLFLAELPNTVFNIFSGTFGSEIIVDIMEFDYQAVANLIEVDLVNDIDRAIFQCNGAYLVEDILTDTFINACANGLDVSSETYSDYKVLEDSDKLDTVSMSEWLFSNEHIDESYIMESALDTLQLLKDRRKKGKSNDAEGIKGKDAVYTWLDAYFSLPEGEEMKSGGREVVPLLIGPTAVFKSATVKELCKKYNYRMVDFRVAFTSRLDYSGLFQIGEVEGKKYSYACPMEEIVVCSDGFREFCKQSYQKLEDILQKGYTESSVASDGNSVETEKKYLTDEQKTKIVELQLQYKNYMRTPVLFCDEITRCFSGSTKVKLLDGRSLTMEELYNEFGTTKPFYVYSCDKDGNVVFKKAYSNGVTRRDADVVKVTLDNGSSIICTPDHRFMLRDGSYEMAMHFERGRSLMSTYFNYKNSTKTPFGSTYETFINPRDMKEYYTHREVARQYYCDTYGKLGKDGCFRNAHHVDFNSLNNVPENLKVMDRIEHYNLHIHGENSVSKRLQSVDGYLDMQRGCMRKAMQHPDFFKNQRKGLEEYWGSKRHNEVMTSDVRNKSFKTQEFKDMCSDRCKSQWDSGQFDNIDRVSANHKANFEKAVRFVKILSDVGYDINIDNYQGFVDTFTGQHGIYYSVVSTDWFNIDDNGYALSDVFDEVDSRDWERFFNSNKKILNKIKSLNYDETKQGICDGTYDTSVGDYVDLSNKGVRDTLSFLNYLLSEYGDFTNREYMEYHSDRDLDKYHFAFRYGNLCKYFGSFARAKDLASVYNHKVVSVEILPYKEDVYDIEVEDTHNFLIDLGDDSGVFVHNCRDKGVNGILVQLLNQKKLNDMTLNGCKFVAATNLDIQKGIEREEYRMELDMLYDVNTDLDVAYSNRFIPLKVYPNDVMDRWFEWASGTTDKRGFKGVTNIHPVVLEFLNNNRDMVYTDKPVLDAIAEGLSDNEQRTQVFPNYRTWDMLSDYLYSVDKTAEAENEGKEDGGEEKLYKRKILEGYVSKWCCEKFIPFLESKGYSNYDDVKEPVKDDVGDFLSTALETGSPAMLIGPSALGKCVTGDTIIRVDGGITEIKNLDFTDGYLEREYVVDGLTDYVTTSHTYREVCDEVVAIKDNYGSVIKVTKNHPLRVLSKEGVVWKKALDIKEGDVLLSKKFDSSYFKDIKHDFNAYMYGFVLGDGCVSNKAKGCNSLTLSYNKERIVTLLNENGFIEDTTKRTRSDNFRSALRDSGKIYRLYKEFPREGRNLKKELWEIGVYNYTWGDVDKEHFPRSGSYEYILNVLAGYIDTDGYIAYSGDYGYVEFCCKSESLISDLQDVLSSLGFKAYRGKDRYDKDYNRYYPRLRLNARDSVELMLLIKDLLVLKHEQAEELISKFGGKTRQGKLDIPLECDSVLRDEINFLIKVCFESKGMTRTQYKDLKTGYFSNDLDRHRTSINNILSFIEDNKLEREFIAYPLWDEFKTISYLRNCNVSTVVSVEEIGTHVVYDVTIPKTHTFIANGFISHNTSRVKQYMKKAKIKTGLEPVLINVNLASKDAVDLMGMPVKQSLTDYVGGGILKGSGLDDVSKELQSVVANVSADIKYGMTDIMTLRAPDKTIKDRFVTALKEGREVILFFDEVNRVSSNTVTSAVFEVISDYRFAGVDFSNYRDRVKVVAACNMAWEGMDDEAGGYGDTGTLDPAFAARFSIYWKKNYDENDVASWIEFMESQKEEGLIDGTLIEFFKGLDTEQALKIMASVEKRTLEDAQPSTRNMLQLSKDIKSMRGKRQENGTFKAKAFNGKILFTDDVVMQFEDLILERQSDSLESHAQKTIKFLDSLLYGSDNWESLLIGDSVKVGDTSISASDIVDSLAQCRDDLKQFTLKPMSADDRVECSDTIDLVEDLAGFVRQLDINTSNKREDMFKMYLGESILGEFTKYFNNTFGTNLDEDISIEQLSDKTLIIPFMKIVQRNFSKYSGNTESIVKYCLDLCNDFMEAHGKTLPNENYAMFLTGIKDILPNADNMVLFLKRSGENLEDMYQLAEGVGDDWIIDITSDFGNKVSREDIENIKKAIKESKKSKTPKNVKYNVL